MTDAGTSTRSFTLRLVVQVVAGATALVATAVIGLLGVGHWGVTVLPATYPCGETYRVHPSCRLAHPDLVHQGWWLMTGVPAICLGAGLLVGALTFIRWRHAAAGPAIGFAVALVAFEAGRSTPASALNDVVP